MVIPTATISVPSSSQAIPPQEKNWLSVSTSLVMRDTRAPRRSSAWSAIESRWMWAKARPRRPYSASSLRVERRATAVRLAMVAMRMPTAAITASRTMTSIWTSPSVKPLSMACWMRIGTMIRPPAPRKASRSVTTAP